MKKLALGVAFAAFVAPSPGRATGKCGDDPFRDPSGKLYVTWVIPLPEGATASVVADTEFPDVDAPGVKRLLGDLQRDLDGRPLAPGLKRQAVPQQSVLRRPGDDEHVAPDADDLRKWEDRYQVVHRAEADPILKGYVARKFRFFGVNVEHPDATEEIRKTLKLCSCMFDHVAVIRTKLFDHVFLRSRFTSRDAARTNVFDFDGSAIELVVPVRDGGKLVLPLAFAELLQEPAGLVVIDVMTPGDLAAPVLPAGFTSRKLADAYTWPRDGRRYSVTRISGALAPVKTADLELALPVTGR